MASLGLPGEEVYDLEGLPERSANGKAWEMAMVSLSER
jgi:hypothetical protein